MFTRIEPVWVFKTFPTITRIFGQRNLQAQIENYNAIISARSIPYDRQVILHHLIRMRGIDPHISMLNLLATLNEEGPRRVHFVPMVARLFHLEENLKLLTAYGISQKTYAGMLTDPNKSFEELIAETEIATTLLKLGGTYQAHNLTYPDTENEPDPKIKRHKSKSNYDIYWQTEGITLRGDVKRFKNWVERDHGENPIETNLLLLQPDLSHLITAYTDEDVFSVPGAIQGALEIIELYRVATSGETPPSGIVVERNQKGDPTAAWQDHKSRKIKKILVDLSTEGTPATGSVAVITNLRGGQQDVGSVRSNLLKAATQVPKESDTSTLSCIFIGSFSPTDIDDVNKALFGEHHQDEQSDEIEFIPGLFTTETNELDLGHIQSVIFFSINYDFRASTERLAVVQRTAHPFCRTNLDSESEQLLATICCEFSKPRSLDITFRDGPAESK